MNDVTIIRIIVNVTSLLLAVYLSIGARSRIIKVIIWTITLLITAGNIYISVNEQKQQTPFVDALIPHIASLEAFDFIKSSFSEDIKNSDLIDVVGSSYICLNKPDIIFHRFPEWLFVFRNRIDKQLLEFKVSDSRLPDPPLFKDNEVEKINEGQIAYYIVSKKGFYDFSGKRVAPDSDINYALDIVDQEGKTLVILQGHGPADNINEVEDGINSRVLARVQIVGRPTDRVSKYTAIEDINKKRSIFIKKANLEANEFYNSLAPINNWKIDADKAIEIAVKKGAKGSPPGKERVGGHPTVRLCSGSLRNLQGSFWKIPYRIDIRPIIVDASSGQLYAVNNAGNYSTKWEKSFEGISNAKESLEDKEKEDMNTPAETYGERSKVESTGNTPRLKEITELNSDELEAANAICRKALEEYFEGQIIAWYKTSYNYLPTSDKDFFQSPSEMKKLITPITVLSITGMITHDIDKLKRELKEKVSGLGVSFNGKELRIVKSLVLIEPGGGGGSFGMSSDKVTIIPSIVAID